MCSTIFEAEYEKERSYNAVRDLHTERSPTSDLKTSIGFGRRFKQTRYLLGLN